jgi:hypothetical protein
MTISPYAVAGFICTVIAPLVFAYLAGDNIMRYRITHQTAALVLAMIYIFYVLVMLTIGCSDYFGIGIFNFRVYPIP